MQNPLKDRRLLAIATARLYSEGRLQTEIANELRISQPEVSRLLRYAQTLGFLDINPTLIRENITDDEWAEVDHSFFSEHVLLAKVRAWVPPQINCDIRVYGQVERQFSIAAASRVLELIEHTRLLGLSWGRSLLNLVAAMPTRVQSGRSNRSIECIPLCGDPLYVMNQDNQDFSASQLAAQMEKNLTGSYRSLPSLTGVPAYLRRDLLEKYPAILHDFIYRIPGYQNIFRGHSSRPLVDRVNTFLTGVGVFKSPAEDDRSSGAFLRERMAQEENFSLEEFSKLILGDVAGILIPRDDISKRAAKRVSELNIGWLGVNGTQIARIAREARKKGPAGVIIIAQGKRKAEIVRQLLKNGWVNELIIDTALAAALEDLP